MYLPIDLDKEVSTILSNTNVYEHPKISITLHTPNEDLVITHVVSVDINMDYNKNITDDINVEFIISLGDYRDVVLKNRDLLEVTIEFDYGNNVVKYGNGKMNSFGNRFIKKKYRFILLDTDNKFNTSALAKMSKDDLDKIDMINITGQCVDPVVVGLKQFIISGSYLGHTVEEVTKGLLANYLNKLSIGGLNFKYIINMAKPDNERVYDHIVIKSDTKLINLPTYLQTNDCGVYNGGINLYIDRMSDNELIINIYPVYDYTKFDDNKNSRLIIYDAPNINMSVHDGTFYLDNKDSLDYKIVTTGMEFIDKGSNDIISVGSGLFNVDPYECINYKNKGYNEEDMLYNTEALLTKEIMDENKTKIVNFINTDIDDNLYKYRSGVLQNNTILAQVSLGKVDIRIFKPGMTILYVYNKNNKIIERRGVLQNVSTSFNIVKKTSTSILHMIFEKEKE